MAGMHSSAKQMLSALRRQRMFELKKTANRLIKEACVASDRPKAKLSVTAYALYKLLSKHHIVSKQGWRKAKEEIEAGLQRACSFFAQNRMEEGEKEIEGALMHIDSIDRQMGHYAQAMLEKAKTKMASSAYSFGISLSQSASLTGCRKKDLLSYIGSTRMNDDLPETKPIGKRVREMRGFLLGEQTDF